MYATTKSIVKVSHGIDNLEGRDAYTSSEFITNLRSKYNVNPPSLTYIAGTMFWVRASIYRDFFHKNPPLEIRSTLERASITDVDGPTQTHAWERLLSWIVTSQGFKIKEI